MKKIKELIGFNGLCCLIAAFVFITICSKSSFLYPINDWGDVNCYFIIGKGILKGLVPYKDLYDQKGIVVFFVFALANIISSTSFIGVYILEVICCFFFLYFTLKISDLFCNAQRWALPICFIVAGSVYSSASICHGGSVEELCLPFFSYGLYLCIRQIVNKKIPSGLEMFIFGIFAGMMFFSKFTLCIFYIVLIVVMIVDAVRNKYLVLLLKKAMFFIMGCIVVSTVVLSYLVYTNSLYEFYIAYVYNSIFNYKPSDVDVTWLFRISTFFRKRNILDIILIGLSFFYLIREKKILLLICHGFAFISIFYIQFGIGYPHKYYGIPLYALEAVGLCIIVELFEKIKLKKKGVFSSAVAILMIVLAVVFTNNKYMLFQKKEDTRQYILAEKMNQYGYDDYHMLSYNNLDDGYYFASGKFPNFRAFIQSNVSSDTIVNEQNDIINAGNVEFIVTKKILCDANDYDKALSKYGKESEKNIVTFKDFKYELVDETKEFYEDEYFLVKLYKIKDSMQNH